MLELLFSNSGDAQLATILVGVPLWTLMILQLLRRELREEAPDKFNVFACVVGLLMTPIGMYITAAVVAIALYLAAILVAPTLITLAILRYNEIDI